LNNILYAALTLGGMGLVFGVVLALASIYLAVKQDPRIPAIIDVLPGANCGGCGFAGCSAFADGVVAGRAEVSGCPVGGNSVAQKVAEIMGVEVDDVRRKVARVKCSGIDGVAQTKYEYEGIHDCIAANKLLGGDKLCPYACLGLGTCAAACPFDAITIEQGVAKIDPHKCTACGKCIDICPKKVIDFTHESRTAWVACNSHNKGAVVNKICGIGCIGCKICEKACEYGAVAVERNLAEVDPDKCVNCGACALKCPRRVIVC
jgi:electron transport complex protein RnfB